VSAVTGTAPIRRPSLPRLSRVELRKMADTRAGFWLLAIVVLLAVAIPVIVLIAGNEDDKTFGSLLTGTVGFTSILLPIVGILAVTSEWSQRTALSTFTLVPERWRVMVAKIVAALLLGVAAVVVCIAVSLLGAAIGGGEIDVSASALGNALLYQLLGMLGGFALGALFLNSPIAIVMYFALPTAVGILGGLIESFPDDWVDTTQTFEPLLENEMAGGDWSRLLVSALIWIALPLLLGVIRLQRAEVKSA
jgi:hypothetical protein